MNMMTGIPPRRTVLSYGVFDGLTPDHLNRLKTLSHLGQELIIGCATDEMCAGLSFVPHMPFEARRAALESCRYVSRVIAQTDPHQQRTDIVNYNVSMLAMEAKWAGTFDGLQDLAQIYYLPHKTQLGQPVTVDQHRLAIAR